VAQETLTTSLGSLFVCQRFGALHHLALVILGVLGLPCAFLSFAPPCCSLLSLMHYVDYWHSQPTLRAAACSCGAGCWDPVLLSVGWRWGGGGLTWHCCCIMSTIGIHNTPCKQWLTVVVLGAGILFFHQMGRGLTWWGILLLGSPGIPFHYPHILAVCCCG